ncbi:SPOR domain-containing protein [Pseudomonas coleopterorum]|uniref:SPOR domain-containing protein n=1 Tax=Pseudomonas coleopterorum TaxID=1605838 RepID=UPI000F04ADA6|nr:SPOR domain-containing protein [Pseudomonas coleopterorum]MBD8482649.1 SPOR domain-containing protein [Pseudomonas coleopterorum]
MALPSKVFKQRMIGALVLVALAVIFLPMLFSRQDDTVRQVQVQAPAAPQSPAAPQVQVEPVDVPEPQIIESEPVPQQAQVQASAPSQPIQPVPSAPAAAAKKPVETVQPSAPIAAAKVAPAAKPDTASKIDPNGLPVSWSVQLASLSNRAGADALQKSLRTQGYNAYVRSSDGKNRVFVGPLVERAEAERLRDVINRQQKLQGFVVRFEPERG